MQNAARLAARTFADAILLGVSAALKLSRLGNGDADALLYPIVTPIVQMSLAIARGSVSRSRVVRDVFRRIRRALPDDGGGYVAAIIEEVVNESWNTLVAEAPATGTPESTY